MWEAHEMDHALPRHTDRASRWAYHQRVCPVESSPCAQSCSSLFRARTAYFRTALQHLYADYALSHFLKTHTNLQLGYIKKNDITWRHSTLSKITFWLREHHFMSTLTAGAWSRCLFLGLQSSCCWSRTCNYPGTIWGSYCSWSIKQKLWYNLDTAFRLQANTTIGVTHSDAQKRASK